MQASKILLITSVALNVALAALMFNERSVMDKAKVEIKASIQKQMPKATAKAFATGCMIALGQSTHISPDDPLYPIYMQWCEKNGGLYGQGQNR